MKQVNCITINTDASFNSQKKVGGYAFYIVCDLFRVQKSGAFKVHPNNSMEAEMMCMVNALHTLLNQKELPSTKLIVVNSDCLFAFERISRKSQDVIGRKIAYYIRQIRIKTAINSIIPKYEFRHVKAHSGKGDARSWVNEWCDKEAKKWMRIAANAN